MDKVILHSDLPGLGHRPVFGAKDKVSLNWSTNTKGEKVNVPEETQNAVVRRRNAK